MRVLITSDSDACAQMYAPVARELLDRGHQVDVGCISVLDPFSIEFTRRGIPVRPLRPLLQQGPLDYDIALCHREPLSILRHNKILTAHVLTMISEEHRHPAAMYSNVDLMLVGGVTHERNLRRAGFTGAVIRTGLPKYDALYGMEIRRDPLILAPDSPSIPMGEERFVFFETLMEVARRFPDMEVLVKPRFLWKQRWRDADFLHGIDQDLYFVAKHYPDAPDNLRILDTYVPNEELVARSSVMLCVQSGAALAQMLVGKPALIIQDLLHAECCQYESEFRSLRTYLLRSGCVVWLREIFDHLPQGLVADRGFVEDEVGLFDGRAAARVVDALEQTVDALGRRIWWIPRLSATSGGLEAALAGYARNVKAMTPEQRREEVRKNMLEQVMQGLDTTRVVFADYAEDLEFAADAARYEELLRRVFAMAWTEEELNGLARKFLGVFQDQVDAAMAYRMGRKYVQNSCRQRVHNLFHRIGLGLAEADGRLDRAAELGNLVAEVLKDKYVEELARLLQEGPARQAAGGQEDA